MGQVELSYPKYFKEYSDITRENLNFFHRTHAKLNLEDNFHESLLGVGGSGGMLSRENFAILVHVLFGGI